MTTKDTFVDGRLADPAMGAEGRAPRRFKSFELMAQDIAKVDVHRLHALSTSVGWPHRATDWELLRRVGQGIVATDGIGRAFGSAMWFPHGDDLASIGLVITSPRTQALGTGRWLMEQVIEACRPRDLVLNATVAAERLYRSLGFVAEATVFQWQGEVAADLPRCPPLETDCSLEAVDDLDQIMALDVGTLGIDRRALLSVLAETSQTCVLRRDGVATGYSMRREFGRGMQVGPIVAANDHDAVQLADVHLRRLAGQFGRVDTREAAGPFVDFVRGCGLAVSETVTTMSLGRSFLDRREGPLRIYGLAGQALG